MASALARVVVTTLVTLTLATKPAAASDRRVPQDFATIQAAIDAAQPGDRVLVGPGVWTGNLDFHAKAITLESTGGAAATTLQAPGGTGVRLGPGGALVGFTLSGAQASFGAAVAVEGFGTRIAANIFQDNVQTAGGSGAAIGGNNASPIIEGNIFRRHSCDSQFLSGVVAFVNTSSPQIRNNVFADNNCRAINMTVPATAAPQVTNNTIVRNPVGIYVDRRAGAGSQTYRNNILAENLVGFEAVFGAEPDNPVWQNNLVFANATNYAGVQDQTGTSGNLSGDPRFRASATGDFRLGRGSAAIDTGSPTGAPATDFDGAPRPLDGNGDGVAAFDLGAFEVAASQLGREIVISPPDGEYFQTQRVDLVVAIGSFATATGGAVQLDGQDITLPFVACAAAGRAGAGAATLRCPGLRVGLLAPGSHTWSVRIDHSDGTSERRTVRWDVKSNTEP